MSEKMYWFEAVPVIDGEQRDPTYFYAQSISESAIERYAEVHQVQRWASIKGKVPPQAWFEGQLEMLGKARAIAAQNGVDVMALDLNMLDLQGLQMAARKHAERQVAQ